MKINKARFGAALTTLFLGAGMLGSVGEAQAGIRIELKPINVELRLSKILSTDVAGLLYDFDSEVDLNLRKVVRAEVRAFKADLRAELAGVELDGLSLSALLDVAQVDLDDLEVDLSDLAVEVNDDIAAGIDVEEILADVIDTLDQTLQDLAGVIVGDIDVELG